MTLPFSSIVPLYGTSTRKNKFNVRYDLGYQPGFPNYGHQNSHDFDLRLIAIRHGERIDTVRGDNWYKEVFQDQPNAPERSYHHADLPSKLPRRNPTFHYLLDPPITRRAESDAARKGQMFLQKYRRIDECYSSPAARSILTADALLRGMGRQSVPIKIEPYLFEPMEFNTALQGFQKIPPCMNRSDWLYARHNVDRRYNPISRFLKLDENLNDFYLRSTDFYNRNIAHLPYSMYTGDRNGSQSRQPYTILIVGHAATPVIYPQITTLPYFDEQKFKKKCEEIHFLTEVVLCRSRSTGRWSRV